LFESLFDASFSLVVIIVCFISLVESSTYIIILFVSDLLNKLKHVRHVR